MTRTVSAAALALAVAVLWQWSAPVPRLALLARRTRDEIVGNVRRECIFASTVSGIVAFLLFLPQRNATGLAALAALPAAGWQVPLVLSRTREKERRRVFDLELTDALGEMVMGVEAGLTLESVMNLYARRHDTSLGREMARAIESINLGSTRAQALQEFRDRTPTPSVSMFVSAVLQNQKLGTPLSAVLRQQARTARRRRQQAVEEYAATLALKMVFPTVFCVLPVLLIVIVGPAIVRLIHALPQ